MHLECLSLKSVFPDTVFFSARIELSSFLWGDKVAPYKVVADQVQMSVGAFKVAVHRQRRRYREILRGKIADTVANPDEVEEELRHLINVISR